MVRHDEVWVETLTRKEVGRRGGGGGCVTIVGIIGWGVGGGRDEGKDGAEESWKWEVHCCIANCEGRQLVENGRRVGLLASTERKRAMGDISWTSRSTRTKLRIHRMVMK